MPIRGPDWLPFDTHRAGNGAGHTLEICNTHNIARPGSVAGVVVNFVSGYRQFGAELLTSGLWAEQNRRGDADTAQRGGDQHRDRKSQLPVDSKIGDDRCNQAAEDRTLVIDEAGRRRAYLGRESFGEIGPGIGRALTGLMIVDCCADASHLQVFHGFDQLLHRPR